MRLAVRHKRRGGWSLFAFSSTVPVAFVISEDARVTTVASRVVSVDPHGSWG